MTDQPPFVNACIAVETALSPHALLARAQEVERAFGRDRAQETPLGAAPARHRYPGLRRPRAERPDLTLPHPRLFERAFVLVPLAEIAPGPDDRRPARRAMRWRELDAAGIERLPISG